MLKIYANLILNGLKTIDDVPLRLREEVEEYLLNINSSQKTLD